MMDSRAGAQRAQGEESRAKPEEGPEPESFPGAGAAAEMAREGRRVSQPVVEMLRYLSPAGEEPAVAEVTDEPGAGSEREWEARLAEKEAEWQARCEAVRQEAVSSAHAHAEDDRMALLRQCAEEWSEAVREFTASRDNYFARVEREVVELALAIASRILQREAQLDPLLLAGAVRVALGQLSETTAVELRVPASAREMWDETLRLMPNLPVVPTVVADSEMKDGECVLTTELGRVDLGVRAQLKEIERGFFDLLSHRAPSTGREPVRQGL